MLKKNLSIVFIFSALSLFFSHQIVPHHHHDTEDVNTHTHKHDHSSENEDHTHHIYDFLLSLIHHADTTCSDFIYVQHNNKLLSTNLTTSALLLVQPQRARNVLFKIQTEPYHFFYDQIPGSHTNGLRGPPSA